MDQKALGQNQFLDPITNLCGTLRKMIDDQAWDDFNPEPLSRYYSEMIAGRLTEIVDQSLDADQLRDLTPKQAQTVGLLLLRDLFRHNHATLRQGASDDAWVGAIVGAVAEHHGIPPSALRDNGRPYDVSDPNAKWAIALGDLIGIPPAELVAAHAASLHLSASHSGIESNVEGLPDEEEFAEQAEPSRKFLRSAPPWMVSSLIHGLILLVFALITFDPVQLVENVLVMTTSDVEGEEMEEFTLDAVEPESFDEEVVEEFAVSTPTMVQTAEIEIDSPEAVLMVSSETPDIIDTIAPMESLTQSLTSMMANTTEFSARSSDMKKQMLKKYGGSDATEAAVTKALAWFERHQLPDGSWSLHHHIGQCDGRCSNPGDEKGKNARNGATALALLPFLGAGQTHLQGKFKKVVLGGLMFLAGNMKVKNDRGMIVGDCRDQGGNMYSHGLATIVLCEAYAMTEDPALAKPAQAALNFIVTAQNSTGGGWRYAPGQAGDTSVVGWMVMALKSGHMGHLTVPPTAVRGASLFLDRVSVEDGVYYGYASPQKKASTTAVGLLCRMYLGWKKTHPSLAKGVEFLGNTGVNGVNKSDVYYNYYAAQVLRQYGGPEWDKFNKEMSAWLVDSQESQGHANGSWYFPSGHTGNRGGRLAVTSFCTMTLEVYYRHLPLYADKAADDDFPL